MVWTGVLGAVLLLSLLSSGIWDVEGQDTVALTALEQIARVINVHASRPAPTAASGAASGSSHQVNMQYAMAVRIKREQCLQGSKLQGLDSLKMEVNEFSPEGKDVYEGQTMVAASYRNEKHSEYRLLLEDGGRVIKTLLENKAGRNDQDCVIFYTYNSPCLKTCLNEKLYEETKRIDDERKKKGRKPIGTYRYIYPALDLFNTVSGPKAFVFSQIYREDLNKLELYARLGEINEKIPLYQCDNNNKCRRCEQENRYCITE